MLNIIFVGAPGTGKGTQAKRLVADPDFSSVDKKLYHISTGELLREEMAKGSALGLEITENMNAGKYVSDAYASQMVMNKTHELGAWRTAGFVFDGFPRTLPQCEFLDRLLSRSQAEVNVVINLVVDSPTLIARILERGKTSGRAEDQTKKAIVNRMKIYLEETTPILDYYKDMVIDIDGTGTPDEVYTRIVKALTGETSE